MKSVAAKLMEWLQAAGGRRVGYEKILSMFGLVVISGGVVLGEDKWTSRALGGNFSTVCAVLWTPHVTSTLAQTQQITTSRKVPERL